MEGAKLRAVRAVLIVDDEESQLNIWQRQFEDAGKRVLRARYRSEAIRLATRTRPDVAIVDLVLGAESGLDVLRDLKTLDSSIFVWVTSMHMQTAWSNCLIRSGADECTLKPLSCSQVLARVEQGLIPEPDLRERQSLREVEWAHIGRTLLDCDNNITRAAAQLGMHTTSLRRKLEKRGLLPLPRFRDSR